VVSLAGVVAGPAVADLDHVSPGLEVEPAAVSHGRDEGRGYEPRLDGGVEAAMKRPHEFALEGGVDLAGRRRVEARGPARRRVVRRGGPGEDGELGLVAGDGQRPVGSKAEGGQLESDGLPELARPQGECELVAAGPAAHPDQAEVPDG